jgi:Fe-S-cluster containining protein
MLHPLKRSHAGRGGVFAVDRVDPRIFTLRYFAACMDCTFCHDSCCQYGADIDEPNVERILEHAPALAARVGYPPAIWTDGEPASDDEYPRSRVHRLQSLDGACVFRNRSGRGCQVHSYCLEKGLDYHDLKPVVCWLFPLTVDRGILQPSDEVVDRSLVCVDNGPTLYESQREEVRFHFGPDLVAELDALVVPGVAAPAAPRLFR